jgi:hypothetical protein
VKRIPFCQRADYGAIEKLAEGPNSEDRLDCNEKVGFRVVKFLSPANFPASDAKQVERFHREVEIQSAIQHPASTRIYAFGFPD